MLHQADTRSRPAPLPVVHLRPAPAAMLDLSFRVPGGPAAPGAARRVLHERAEALPRGVRADVLLLLSELVSNAVLHGDVGAEGTVGVLLQSDDRRLRAQVTDPGAGFDWERRRRQRPRREGGFGLALVERIAERWGIERESGCTQVWFELEIPAR